MRASRSSWRVAALSLALFASASWAVGPTAKHEAGRCALRGNCGSDSFFGPQLPCPDNEFAEDPEPAVREKLLSICGEQWADKQVCCREEQLDTLKSNLKTADQLISSCPACRENFVNLFCTFTCSADQSLFVNVTQTKQKGDKLIVTELDYLVSDEYGVGFYNSCSEVKFGPTNSRAMDLIGGGAKNFTQFLKFLGDKKFGGSPFQLNFPRPSLGFPGMKAMDKETHPCDDSDPKYRCACVDCSATCVQLPELTEEKACHVGVLPCLSFSVIIVYSAFLLLLITGVSGHVAYQKHAKSKHERLRLLQDAAPSDDEDEGDMVHNVALLDRPQRHYFLNTLLDRFFSRLGYICARFPAITIGTSVLVVGLLSLGWLNFAVELDPVRLWVAPDSAAATEKEFFDSNFGPFFRAEQAFITNRTHPESSVVTYDNLRWWFDVENRVKRLRAPGGITLNDVCFKPTDACVVQSFTGYFGNDVENMTPWNFKDQLASCSNSPGQCLPDFQQPLDPKMVFGGWSDSVLDAKAIVVTWVVNNFAEGSPEVERAMTYENELKRTLIDVQREGYQRGLRVSFNTEISLEQELNKSTNTDAGIIAISYLVMFLYASLALGSTTLGAKTIMHNTANALVQSKFMLGIMGIVIVLMSVSASVGLFSAAGIKVTLIIAEVIPFLVLAVGVDNIFLIVHEFERVNINHAEDPIDERMAKTLGRMGPSILLSATTETVAFGLGAAVGMPAVRNFAAYASGAVLINALLQVTMFVAVLALNQRRVEARRADCFPCIRIRSADRVVPSEAYDEGSLQQFIRKKYAPALLGNKAKVAIVTVFLGLFAAGLALVPEVKLGLDQRIAMPGDSYLIDYFNDLDKYFGVGPPVYFVTRELNVTQRENQEELCGRFLACEPASLGNILEGERKRADESYIADATANWVDDFFLWLNPAFEDCCVIDGKPCFADRTPAWNSTLYGMPQGKEYVDYLTKWLNSPTTSECPLGGKASYGNAVVVDTNRTTIPASHFRTSHTPLHSQEDFIAAYRSARRIADDISEATGASVFPYSKFYIFFDQYVSIVKLSIALLGSALGIIFALTTLLLGSVSTGAVVTLTVTMTLVDIVGAMALFDVSLNAVSLVNLIISVGISLEFCAHIARAFQFPSTTVMDLAPRNQFGTRDARDRVRGSMGARGRLREREVRAWTALVNVGASVFSGITVTKMLGVAVLAFTRSKIFEVYYFRVWLALVVFGALHALVFLPVALALVGGEGYVDPESEGGLEADLRSRRYLLEDDYDSDEY
ncbi:niemann-pick C type protein family [Trichodelitschia bisporula]|uniref:Niemann-pick C type protein family n=1 Tax=Trichodelitschia bisporula TaxID=703511 RepID=A0A6G1HM01_9PEZI|nr:niemann-pick C type protein family [Trichodelitschia bisporula]